MTGFQSDFVDAIDTLDLPAVDLAPGVLRQIGEVPESARGVAVPRARPLAVALVATAVLGLVLTMVLQPTRNAVADWLGIGATGVEPLPDTTDRETPTTSLVPSASELGEPVPGADFDPIPALGKPQEVLDGIVGGNRGRSFVWAANEQFPALGDTEFGVVLSVRSAVGQQNWKAVASDLDVRFLQVAFGEHPTTALWIPGSHQLVLAGANQPLLAERVLLWVGPDGGVEYRLETNGSQESVMALVREVDSSLDLLPLG